MHVALTATKVATFDRVDKQAVDAVAITLIVFRCVDATLRGDVIAALLYGFNWFQIWVGTSYFTSFEFVPLRHLWSLAVEEQFYLIWPVVMLIVAKFGKRRLPIVSAVFFGLAVILAIYTALVYQPGTISNIGDTPNQFMSLFGQSVSRIDFLFLGTLTRSSGLLLGAALGDVARARGMSKLARDTGLSRESLYKSLSGERAPSSDTLFKVLKALGFKLTVAPSAAGEQALRPKAT